MRQILLLTIGLLATAVAVERAEAQLLKRVAERVKQKVTERKQQTEESVLNHAAEPADWVGAKARPRRKRPGSGTSLRPDGPPCRR